MRLLLRWILNALALLALTQIVEGFGVSGFYIALIAALVLGLLNAIVRPVLLILTLPINLVTLGLFTFVINAGLIWFMSTFIKGVEVTSFWFVILVAMVLWAVGVITNFFLKQEKETT